MSMRQTLAALLCLLPLGGCAGTLSQVMNPPITSDHLDEPDELNKLKTVSGDRRLVRVTAFGHSDANPSFYKFRICAETQADAISARSAKSLLNAKLNQSLADEASETLTATYARTELSDVVRQLSWQFCNARENGDFTDTDYKAALNKLAADSMEVLKLHAKAAGDAATGDAAKKAIEAADAAKKAQAASEAAAKKAEDAAKAKKDGAAPG